MKPIKKQDRKRKPDRIIIHGGEGTGKSTWASHAPNPIFIQTEDGLGDIDVDVFPLARKFGDVIESIEYLLNESHEYKTVVIDSLDWLEKLLWVRVCEIGDDKGRKMKTMDMFGFSKGYEKAVGMFFKFCRHLDKLCDKGMMVILISHTGVERINGPLHDEYTKYSIDIHKKSAPVFREWADFILYSSVEVITVEGDSGKNKAKTTGKYQIFTSSNPAYDAKSHADIPSVLPMPKANPFKPFADAVAKARSVPKKPKPINEQPKEKEKPKDGGK
jgi:hypothetical protein